MPDENARIELSKYRLGRAQEAAKAAANLVEDGSYLDGLNRAYYAVFHAIRSVLAIEGVDFKKHSAVISHFQKEYIKTGVFPVDVSDYIKSAFEIRNDSDYEDFYLASRADAVEQLEHAQFVIKAVGAYLEQKYEAIRLAGGGNSTGDTPGK